MAVSYLSNISWLSLLLLLGVIASIIALKFKLPQLLLLILIGVALGQTGWVSFEESFLISFGVFALVMIVFDSTSKLKLREINTLYPKALKLAIIFLLTNLIFFTIFTHLFFGGVITVSSVLISLLFSSMMSGTDAGAVLAILKNAQLKVAKFLEFESIINTPITVIIPLVILFWFEGTLQAGDIFVFFIRGIMAGVGTGLILGVISFRLMKKQYLETVSPLLIIALALISYTLAELVGGNGVLSVTTLGIVFGWAVIKQKENLQKFVKIFTNFLTIVVFILLGLLIKLPGDANFLLKSLGLFGIYLGLRFISVSLSFKKEINLKEKIFMSLNVSKGVAVAVIAFIILAKLAGPGLLSSLDLARLNEILELSFLFILYSVIISSATMKFSKFFLGGDITPKE